MVFKILSATFTNGHCYNEERIQASYSICKYKNKKLNIFYIIYLLHSKYESRWILILTKTRNT